MLEYFALPVEQLVDELGAIDAERLGAAIDVEAVAGLVLHLGDQRHLALEARRAGDPVAFGQHADDLGVRVLRHHPDELRAVALGHPVLRLDGLAGGDSRLERGVQGFFGGVLCLIHLSGFHGLLYPSKRIRGPD